LLVAHQLDQQGVELAPSFERAQDLLLKLVDGAEK